MKEHVVNFLMILKMFIYPSLIVQIYNPQIEIVSPAETKQYFNIFILKNEMV